MTGLRETGRLHRPDGVNWQPEFEVCQRGEACVWLNQGTEADISKAKQFASPEGYRVFTFPVSENDPLAKARNAVLSFPAGATVTGIEHTDCTAGLIEDIFRPTFTVKCRHCGTNGAHYCPADIARD